MTHEKYIQSIHKEQSLIRRLFKSRSNISTEIEKITKDYYKDIIGKFFYISPENRNNFKYLNDGFYFIHDIGSCSNYASDDKVEIQLYIRQYGTTTNAFDNVVGVDIMEKTLYFSPSTDMKSKIEPLIVPKEEALKPLKDYCNQLIDNFKKKS